MGPPLAAWFCVVLRDAQCGSSDMGDRCRNGLVALMVSGTQKKDSREERARVGEGLG